MVSTKVIRGAGWTELQNSLVARQNAMMEYVDAIEGFIRAGPTGAILPVAERMEIMYSAICEEILRISSWDPMLRYWQEPDFPYSVWASTRAETGAKEICWEDFQKVRTQEWAIRSAPQSPPPMLHEPHYSLLHPLAECICDCKLSTVPLTKPKEETSHAKETTYNSYDFPNTEVAPANSSNPEAKRCTCGFSAENTY